LNNAIKDLSGCGTVFKLNI